MESKVLVNDIVKKILKEIKEINDGSADHWSPKTNIISDIGLDSLQIINFLLKLEDELGIEIDFEEFNYSHLQSLKKFEDFISKNYNIN